MNSRGTCDHPLERYVHSNAAKSYMIVWNSLFAILSDRLLGFLGILIASNAVVIIMYDSTYYTLL